MPERLQSSLFSAIDHTEKREIEILETEDNSDNSWRRKYILADFRRLNIPIFRTADTKEISCSVLLHCKQDGKRIHKTLEVY